MKVSGWVDFVGMRGVPLRIRAEMVTHFEVTAYPWYEDGKQTSEVRAGARLFVAGQERAPFVFGTAAEIQSKLDSAIATEVRTFLEATEVAQDLVDTLSKIADDAPPWVKIDLANVIRMACLRNPNVKPGKTS